MRARIVPVLVLLLAVTASGRQTTPSEKGANSGGAKDPAADVLAFEREMEAAVVRGDVAFLDKVCASDFTFTHGDGWTTGGQPLRVESKQQWLASVGKAPYLYRNLDSVQVELHGDVAITYGMYRAENKTGSPDRGAFTVWFERVYALRGGRWQYLSHRTVHGPTYDR
jgi:ketosteroid isomerase-like protein